MEKTTQREMRLHERYARRVKEIVSTGEPAKAIVGPYDRLKDEFEMIVEHVARGSKPILLDSEDSNYFENKFLASLLLSSGVSKWPEIDWRYIKHADICLVPCTVCTAWDKLGTMQRFIAGKRSSRKILVRKVTNDCVSYNVLCNIEQVGVRVSMYQEEDNPYTVRPDRFAFRADYFVRTKGGKEFIVYDDMYSRDYVTADWKKIKRMLPYMRSERFTDDFWSEGIFAK